MPANFFGGETFLGNRYILAAYPCLLVALPRLPSRRSLLTIWALAAVVGISALASQLRFGALDATSQAHANAGIFRLLPYESTASNLDGRRDRYWADDFVRFVDPFAEAGEWSFTIESGRPAAELEIATRFPDGADAPDVAVADADPVTLVICRLAGRAALSARELRARHDPAASSSTQPPPPGAGTASGGRRRSAMPCGWCVLGRRQGRRSAPRCACATSGRHAPPTDGLRVRGRRRSPCRLRSRRVADDGRHAGAQHRHLDLELRRVALRSRSARGSSRSSPARARPASRASSCRGRSRRGRASKPRSILEWPTVPGRYRVSLDLVAEDLAWFADKVGAPLASGEVEVRAP